MSTSEPARNLDLASALTDAQARYAARNPASARAYDPKAIAENILDFMDGDTTSINGRSEDEYYRRQDPPYRAWNRPLVSVDQLALVEEIVPPLLAELRNYVTVHPIGGKQGINLNRAEPWVLKLVFAGTSGNRRLIDDRLVEDLYARMDGMIADVLAKYGEDAAVFVLSDAPGRLGTPSRVRSVRATSGSTRRPVIWLSSTNMSIASMLSRSRSL